MTATTTSEETARRAKLATERLRAALALADMRLPSLRAGHCFANFPHVELGGCHADVADRLAAWIEAHADGCR